MYQDGPPVSIFRFMKAEYSAGDFHIPIFMDEYENNAYRYPEVKRR